VIADPAKSIFNLKRLAVEEKEKNDSACWIGGSIAAVEFRKMFPVLAAKGCSELLHLS